MQPPSSNLPHVLITGGAGFIGSHLAEALLGRGHRVSVIDDLSTGRFGNIQHLVGHPGFHFAIDTIINEVVMDRLASECQVIFHLAAAVGVRLIVDAPVHTIQTNIMGTEAVLRIARRYRARVLLASTSEVYGKGNQVPFREDSDVVLGPTTHSRWSYATSKLVDEFLALAYQREYGLPVVVFRLFNTIGPRQTGRYGMVVPRFIKQFLNEECLSVYGDGGQSRCFLGVQDAVRALLALLDHPGCDGQVFNVGSTEEVTILELARKILALAGEGIDPMRRITFVPYEQAYTEGFEDMRRRVPDITKVRRYTGWEPQHSLEKVLASVIEEMQARSA